MSTSQKAFHQHFKLWGEFAFCQDDDGDYTEVVTIKMFADWQAAVAHGRKQALEEAIAICKSHKGGGSNGIQAARVCAYNIQELLK